MKLICILIVGIFPILQLTQSQSVWPRDVECGKLNQTSFYKQTNVTDLREYPFLGRIGFWSDNGLIYNCLGVLISHRYLLSAAHCFESVRHSSIVHIVLGDWNASNSLDVNDCTVNNDCGPKPKIYEMEELIIHPSFNEYRKIADLALLRLVRDVVFNDFISPICMPPPELTIDSYVGQFLPFVGFAGELPEWGRDVIDRGPLYRSKLLTHVMSTLACQKALGLSDYETNSSLCGITDGQSILISGSALLSIITENGEPKRFYLVGFVTAGARQSGTSVPDIYMPVAGYRNWIERNIVI